MAAIYGRSTDQKESPVDWTPHEDVTRQATEAGSLSTFNCLLITEREGALVFGSSIHQEKPEAEIHKD